MAMMDVEVEDFAFDDSWVNYFIGEAIFMLVTGFRGGCGGSTSATPAR